MSVTIEKQMSVSTCQERIERTQHIRLDRRTTSSETDSVTLCISTLIRSLAKAADVGFQQKVIGMDVRRHPTYHRFDLVTKVEIGVRSSKRQLRAHGVAFVREAAVAIRYWWCEAAEYQQASERPTWDLALHVTPRVLHACDSILRYRVAAGDVHDEQPLLGLNDGRRDSARCTHQPR